MRFGWSDDEDTPGQFALYWGNVERSVAGKKGQAMLREVRAALLALPEKRLVSDAIASDGEVCAVGAWLVAQRVAAGAERNTVLAEYADPDTYGEYGELTEEVAAQAGAPKLVAWRLVEMNDYELDNVTPEERYRRVLAWVESVLAPTEASDA